MDRPCVLMESRASQAFCTYSGFAPPFLRMRQRLRIKVVSRGMSLPKSAYDIRRHEDNALVFLPPAPATVFVLEAFQTLDACLNFLLQLRCVHGCREVQVLHRLSHNNVWEKTRHGLFRASVRIVRQIFESAKNSSCDG